MIIAPYAAEHEPSWLRCRAAAFADTEYFDDVLETKPSFPRAVELVALVGDDVVALLDISIAGDLATIESVAVLPEHRRDGLASALWSEAAGTLRREGVREVEAWTRADAAANAWYRRHGFTGHLSHLQIQREDGTWFDTADLTAEQRLRAEFPRVHVCRRYARHNFT